MIEPAFTASRRSESKPVQAAVTTPLHALAKTITSKHRRVQFILVAAAIQLRKLHACARLASKQTQAAVVHCSCKTVPPARHRRAASRRAAAGKLPRAVALALWTGLSFGSTMDDAGYREVAERALGYARVEFRDEIASLKRENAALKRKVGRKPRGGGSAAGHGPVVEDDPDSSSLLLAVKRARTLALFLLLLSCTTAILEGYEETLAAHVSLSFFVPFLIGHGGNCGGMSVGAVISAIARGDARTPSSKYRLALREILAGCAVAVQLGALAAVTMHFTGFDRDLSTVVVAALAAITALGAVCGSVIPLCGNQPVCRVRRGRAGSVER